MQIQINTDNSLQGQENLADAVEREIHAVLGRFSDRITRIEVHLGDTNGAKHGGDDKRCLIEVRLAGRKPETVTEQAESVGLALGGAARKMARLLETAVGKTESAKGGETIRRTDQFG
ncbi:MAG: hypothetical protein KF700_06540 [Hyphomonadaceae bacterium]|nr:hypothetical protein [Hyphomonadaceae bacterium]